MINIRTDLALEATENYKKMNEKEMDGIIIEEKETENVKITSIKVVNEEGSIKIGKPLGNYITVEISENTVYDPKLMEESAVICGKILRKLIGVEEEKTALVVGLGNWKVTPDSLGPKVMEKIMITRHLKKIMPEEFDEEINSVCAISPGVLGLTGIETVEIVKGLVQKIKPSVVICVDSLASRKIERINRTIQISDAGISPGAGVNNKRMRIDEESLGVKVIAIGVPTVVDAATIVNDSMDLILEELSQMSERDGEFYKMLSTIDKNEKSKLIKSLLKPYLGDLMVTPKEVDLVIDGFSKIISKSINIGVQPNLEIEEINNFMN
ncbi:GPR endopeptidase [uncultured Clostridium sp.]|uniref:GPR endopeptidase n=1 Tax=uncultured Clostridium sp. TaxID=59620 RepID=UPI00261F1989|nr:GPR endopeptidase [uncultured Clostridium sp.]